MKSLHSLLCRQLRRQFGGLESLPDELRPFINAVNSAYLEFDKDRELVERSLELSSNELMRANTNMQAIFNALPDLFFLISADGVVIDFKSGSRRFIDLMPKHVLNSKIFDIPSIDNNNALATAISGVRHANKQVTTDYEIVIGDERCYVEANLFPVSGERIAVLLRDITARKLAELHLQTSHQRLRQQNQLLIALASNKNLTEGSIDYALEMITMVTARGINVDRASIWYFNDDNTKLRCVKLYDKKENAFSSGLELDASDFPIYIDALKNNRQIVADNAHTHPFTMEFSDVYLTPSGIGSMMDASIKVGSRTIGVICTEHVGSMRTWAPEEVNFSSSMADFVTLALESRERQKAQKALTESEDKFRILAETTDSAIFVFRERILYVNPAMQSIFGYCCDEFLEMTLADLIHAESQSLVKQFKHQYQAGIEESIREEIRAIDSEGNERWIFLSTALIKYEQQSAILATAFDITDRKQMEDQLRHQAFHDRLTGLPNRALFADRVEHVMVRYKRQKDYRFAVLFIDLDRFKVVNDSLGHMVGDELLVESAKRICQCVRQSDTVTRLGGDEFTILMEDLHSIDCALHVAEKIQTKLAEPFTIRGQSITTTASIGIALSNPHYDHADQIVRDADIAMYRAKCNGKSRCEIFDEKMHTRAMRLLQLENDLRGAIKRNEFELHYQPIIELGTNAIAGLESLIRWVHPDHGNVPPNEFIPLAEETGMILDIGDWVFREACSQIKEWSDQFKHVQLPEININVSGVQLSQGDITRRVVDTINEYGINSTSIKLELTESMVMEDPANVSTIITELKKHHVRTAIDDFGTGYSSLSYLHTFPIDTLKIDRSFVNTLQPDGNNAEIVNAIVVLAHNLGLDVVAEGIETEYQLRYLKAIGCDFGQGFYYAKPLPSHQIEEMLASSERTASLNSRGQRAWIA